MFWRLLFPIFLCSFFTTVKVYGLEDFSTKIEFPCRSTLQMAIFTSSSIAIQEKATIKGRLIDKDGKAIDLAAVGVVNLLKSIGTTTDEKGYYILSVPANTKLILRFSHASFETKTQTLTLQAEETKILNFELQEKEIQIKEVTVTANRSRGGYVSINPLDSRTMPGITGGVEATLMSLPGVNNNNELSSQYSVRGGNFDENLVYVNGIEIQRSLLTGAGEQEGLSFINPDLVETMLFSSGGFDAKYGDKMSSVLDIQYKKPTHFGGSIGLNFMGGHLHLEGTSKDKKFTFLFGLRHKSTQYVLKSMDKKGNYKPSFTDFQALFTYKWNEKNEWNLLGNIAYNRYKVIPTTQQTKFGTEKDPKAFTVAFRGQEIDKFNTYFGALSWINKPNKQLKNNLTFSFFNTIETENYDIEGAYLLKAVIGEDNGSSDEDDIVLGEGGYLDHARNYLNGLVVSLDYQASYITKPAFIQWGLKYQYEDMIDRLDEWHMEDSAGYTLPEEGIDPPGTLDPNLHPPVLQDVYKSQHHTQSHRLQAFAQGRFDFNSNGKYNLNAGLRLSYWSLNNEFIASPRVNFTFNPSWKTQTSFRLAVGHYAQPPFYKELRDIHGNLHTDVRAQKSVHIVLGNDVYFQIWQRPFKFTAEAYYKYMYDLNPYEIDNIRIRYMAKNCSKGYATGLDARLYGEFVPGVESWISLSFMKTNEDITYTDAKGNSQHTGMVARPTDQLFAINVYFQDYLTRNKNFKVYLNFIYATGLPDGNADNLSDPQKFPTNRKLRLPDYKRVDLGMAFLLKGEKRKYGPKNPFTYIKNIWLGVEVFNLFQMRNTISYMWITAIDGNSYAIPNRLTPLQINVKLDIDF